ncbi:hypothetical protein KKF84_09395, partial [Myxococcota bacterium]|nr:hypothetical protein [Myxococcota bacterium]MBU1535524.1 hypothetical protein [Myxococcota bacterium]
APMTSPSFSVWYYYSKGGSSKADTLQQGGGYTRQEKGKKEIIFYFWVSSQNALDDYKSFVKNRDVSKEPECGPWRKK